MRRRTGTLAIAGLMGTLLASPLFAQDAMSAATMTCAEFMAMDPDGQMQAVQAMEAASSGGLMAEGEMAAEGMMTEGEGEMAAEGEMAEGGDEAMMAEGDGMMEEQIASISAACEGDPDMMAADAMMSATDQ
jgi:hypothetical protein